MTKHNTDIIDTRGLHDHEKPAFIAMGEALSERYELKFEKNIDINSGDLEMCKGYSSFEIRNGLRVSEAPFFARLAIIRVSYDSVTGKLYRKDNITEHQTWGHIHLKKDYGHVLLKHETLREKLLELFHVAEIDFEEDPEFSKHFYLLASDQDKARRLFDPALRDAFKAFPSGYCEAEILGNKLVIATKRALNTDDALSITEFLETLIEKQC